MINLTLNPVKYENDILELCRMFQQFTDENVDIRVDYEFADGVLLVKITTNYFEKFVKHFRYPLIFNSELEFKRLEK